MDINITFCKGGKEWCVCAQPNQTILEVARKYDIPLPCECEGSVACSTCHVVVRDREIINEVNEVQENVEDIDNIDKEENMECKDEEDEEKIKPLTMYDKTIKIVPISDEENDMLDLATGLSCTSRLGCQVKITEELEGAIFEIPCENRNSPPISTREKEAVNS